MQKFSMAPDHHAVSVMLPHLLRWIQIDRAYAAVAIPEYFKRCPWAEPLIGPQLREAWKARTQT